MVNITHQYCHVLAGGGGKDQIHCMIRFVNQNGVGATKLFSIIVQNTWSLTLCMWVYLQGGYNKNKYSKSLKYCLKNFIPTHGYIVLGVCQVT